MSEETDNTPKGNVADTINATKDLVKEIPVYQDLVQPAAKELGKGLETAAKAVNVALAPVAIMVWGYDKIKENFIETEVAKKMESVDPKDIISPALNIAVPAIEALRYTAEIDELRDLFANLLVTSMDKNYAGEAHPSFVEVIKQLSPDEAKLIKYLGKKLSLPIITLYSLSEDTNGIGLGIHSLYYNNFTNIGEIITMKNVNHTPHYIDNLSRLGLVSVLEEILQPESIYRDLENHTAVQNSFETIKNNGKFPYIKKKHLSITDFGKLFFSACITENR